MNGGFNFSKEKTEYIKGIAILLMLFHHFFGFPEWQQGVSYIGIPLRVHTLEYAIGRFSHICVALFAFVTGYGMFFSYRSGNIVRKSVKRGISFLVGYYIILFGVAIPVNLILGKTDIGLSLIAQNLFAFDNTLVSFAWYVRFYLALLLTLPLLFRIMSRRGTVTLPLFLLAPPLLGYAVSRVASTDPVVIKCAYFASEYLLWLPCALSGMCFAKYGLFDFFGSAADRLGRAKAAVLVFVLAILAYFRAYFPETLWNVFNLDCIYAPVFVFLFCNIAECLPQPAKRFLRLMSRHSMNLWFLHSLFFFRTAQLMPIAYFPRLSILIIAWVILLLLPISSAANAVHDRIMSFDSRRGRGAAPPKKISFGA